MWRDGRTEMTILDAASGFANAIKNLLLPNDVLQRSAWVKHPHLKRNEIQRRLILPYNESISTTREVILSPLQWRLGL